LLSPSTDEEDLFDVPPDLPEDSATKEDSLFGRAPILSPIANLDTTETEVKSTKKGSILTKSIEYDKGKNVMQDDKKEEKSDSVDPLRDDSHDPLEDPSQLFAFVTKTPSPDKHKGLLFFKIFFIIYIINHHRISVKNFNYFSCCHFVIISISHEIIYFS
jgi:hypothetical protein